MFKIINKDFFKIVLSLIIYLLSLLMPTNFKIVFIVIAYILISYEIYKEAFNNLKEGIIFDENLLMIIATLGAFIIKSFEEAFMVMFLFEVGEYLADLAVSKSKRSLLDLLDLKKDTLTKLENKKEITIPLTEAKVGDKFIVKPGERIALDGVVIKGSSFVDTSSLTGESIPKKIEKTENVLSGYINRTSPLVIEATTTSTTSTTARIMSLLESADKVKSKTETYLTKFAKVYTPTIVLLALFIGVGLSVITKDYNTWIYRALVFLVTACPCALVISIPLAYFCGIGSASRKGILIKGSKELDTLNEIKYIFLDKTGTLTKGNFVVAKVKSISMEKSEFIKYVASVEANSLHPIALAIKDYYKGEVLPVKNFKEISGKGLSCSIDNKELLVGNKKFLSDENIEVSDVEEIGTIIYVSIDKKFAGYIVIADEMRKSAKSISSLKDNFADIIILSGDKTSNVEKLAKELKLKSFYGELLPQDKINYVKKYQEKGKCMFVGDGINDAPVIKIADIGVAMIKSSDASLETSDVVLMKDDLNALEEVFGLAKRTKKKIIVNITFALTVKFVVLLLALLGISTIWMAVFADVGVTFLVILNVLTLFIKK